LRRVDQLDAFAADQLAEALDEVLRRPHAPLLAEQQRSRSPLSPA